MIEPTDEMVEAFVAFGVDESEFLLADARAGLAAVLAIVERDYELTWRTCSAERRGAARATSARPTAASTPASSPGVRCRS